MKHIIYTENLESAVACAKALGTAKIDGQIVTGSIFEKAKESGYIETVFSGSFAVIVWKENKEILSYLLPNPAFNRIYIAGNYKTLECFAKDFKSFLLGKPPKDLRYAKIESKGLVKDALSHTLSRGDTEKILEEMLQKVS